MRTKFVTAMVMIAAALTAAGCGGDDKVSADAKKDFIKGCASAGQPEKGCECVFDELKERGIDTEKKFEDLADKVKKGEITDDFREAATSCKDELTTQ